MDPEMDYSFTIACNCACSVIQDSQELAQAIYSPVPVILTDSL